MPTGYTSDIYEGKDVSFQEFILKCARAFGATIMMRDEPLDSPIPEFQPNTYYLESLEREQEQLKRYESMTLEEVEKEIEESHQRKIQENKKYYEEKSQLRAKYLEMIDKVNAWNPPTSDHEKLKKFCLDQLNSSLDSDCYNIESYLKTPEKEKPEQWIKNRIEWCKESIERNKKHYEGEVQITSERNLWVKQLKNSLKENF